VLLLISGAVLGQRRGTRRPATERPRSIDYSKFSHATAKHRDTCATCHNIPTNNWKEASAFPDVADYPDHDACVRCHRSQFFKGARPVICTVCHTNVSPRDDGRFAFAKPGVSSQFSIEFPHDKHQDVIARFLAPRRTEEFRFVRVSSFSLAADDKTKNYNNCTICHVTRPGVPATPAKGWLDNFVPFPATFKSSPGGHAACFNCHWKSQPPVNNKCEGCHRLAETPTALVDPPKRISMKFRHEREQHIAECTTCHINITKAASLRGLKPDVPITSCSECHNKEGLRTDVTKELEALDKNRDFVCTYCHTSDVGRLDPPASHYLIAGREPLKRKDLK
jgi:hypothetical protein